MKSSPIAFDAIGRPISGSSNRRKSHHHIIGASGSGKSKFLEQMIRYDLRNQQGFCLIDPHGTLYEAVLKYCAHYVYSGDLILLNLSEPEHIVGFNFFTKDPVGDTSVQVDNLLQATLHAWDAKNADSTPTLERVLKLIYTTILEANMTLPQVATLLDYSAKEIRTQLIEQISDDLIRREWHELSNLTKAREFRDEILSAKNRLFRFLTSTTLMRFIGLKNRSIDLHEAMDRQKTILVNLAPSNYLSRENGRLFGSLLVNQFFQAALLRKADKKGGDPKAFYLYLDEFQNFVSIDLCNSLDEVRKFGLFFILSHQRFGQLDEQIEDAILTNCRIKTVFGGLPVNDARRMAEELFIGQIDPLKVKVAIYQTKFWPVYSREKVYGSSRGTGGSSGRSSGSGSGYSSGSQIASLAGQTSLPESDGFFTGEDWFRPPSTISTTESQSSAFSSAESYSSFDGESYSESWSEGESVADIPIFVPVPFEELSSVQYSSIEEQLFQMTQALKLSEQRRCFMQFPGEETQPLLIPFVQEYVVKDENLRWYTEWLAQKSGAVTPEEADRELSLAQETLLQSFPLTVSPSSTHFEEKNLRKTKSGKRSIFDQIKEQNPDIDL